MFCARWNKLLRLIGAGVGDDMDVNTDWDTFISRLGSILFRLLVSGFGSDGDCDDDCDGGARAIPVTDVPRDGGNGRVCMGILCRRGACCVGDEPERRVVVIDDPHLPVECPSCGFKSPKWTNGEDSAALVGSLASDLTGESKM